MIPTPQPSRVFEDVSADYFTCGGRDFLVYVDRLSGWPVVYSFHRGNTTSKSLITAVRKCFTIFGVPVKFRSDGGPQFSSHDFRQFLKRWGVTQVQSSPHYPQSNGHAESAVKAMKKIISSTTENGNIDKEEFDMGLLEYRNTPRKEGLSPAQILYGHPLRSIVPMHHRSFDPKWHKSRADFDRKVAENTAKVQESYDQHAKSLGKLPIGTTVWIQNWKSMKWDLTGEVIGIGNFRKYHVKTPSGKTLWRNRRFLRPCK